MPKTKISITFVTGCLKEICRFCFCLKTVFGCQKPAFGCQKVGNEWNVKKCFMYLGCSLVHNLVWQKRGLFVRKVDHCKMLVALVTKKPLRWTFLQIRLIFIPLPVCYLYLQDECFKYSGFFMLLWWRIIWYLVLCCFWCMKKFQTCSDSPMESPCRDLPHSSKNIAQAAR